MTPPAPQVAGRGRVMTAPTLRPFDMTPQTYADDLTGTTGSLEPDSLIEYFASAARSYRTDRLVLWLVAA